jgi:hypothetical protein
MTDYLEGESRKIVQRFVELLDRHPDAQEALQEAFFLGGALAATHAKQGPTPLTMAVQCRECATNLIVLPAVLYKAVGDRWGSEGELELLVQIKTDEVRSGERLAFADVDGRYTCPQCGHPDLLAM